LAADALLQSNLAAERLSMDGAYFRVHHFARQLASPFSLLAAVGARTRSIEIGTAVIDMRHENPHYMVEDADAADLIAGGRSLAKTSNVLFEPRGLGRNQRLRSQGSRVKTMMVQIRLLRASSQEQCCA